MVAGLSFSAFTQSKMVKIPSGSFNMGSPTSERQRNVDEKQHLITLSSFYADAYEVTQKSFQSVMGKNPSVFKGDNLPVENVSCFDAIEYRNRLSEREGFEKCYTVSGKDVTWNRAANGYRLLTQCILDVCGQIPPRLLQLRLHHQGQDKNLRIHLYQYKVQMPL